jgi:hypothetical protein
MQERSNVLGISVPNLNPWAQQFLKTTGSPDACPPLGCILKLYDGDQKHFKLCEQMSCFGILEFKPSATADASAEGDFVQGVPNEENSPVLHVMAFKKLSILFN